MLIEKKITVELTEQEYSILTHCEQFIDELIDKMEELNLRMYDTEYDSFEKDTLDELAKDIHSLKTVYSAI